MEERWDETTGNYQERNEPTFLQLPDYNEYYSQRWEKTRVGQCGNENLGNT